MDKANRQQLDAAAAELSLNELTPVTSSEGEYSQSPLASSLQTQPFFYDPSMTRNMYQPQQFSLQHFQPAQNLFPIDPSQAWSTSIPQQSYFPPVSASIPEHSASAPVVGLSSSVRHDYVPLAKRPSISGSIHSGISDGEEHSAHDEAGERRKERRRAQNRAAQRAFRARKEETIKESSSRLDALQDELARLQSSNTSLSETVSSLRAQISMLQQENALLKRSSGVAARTSTTDWESNFNDSAGSSRSKISKNLQQQQQSGSSETDVLPSNLNTALSNDSGIFDVSNSGLSSPIKPRLLESTSPSTTTSFFPPCEPTTSGFRRSSAVMIAEAINDAALTLNRQR